MFTIEPVIESIVDFNALANCIDMTVADQRSSKPVDKLSIVASGIFGLDISEFWIYLTFYVRLPTDIIEIINAFLVCHTKDHRGISEGFISGTLATFKNFILIATNESVPTRLRRVANEFYTYLREKYNILKNCEMKQLSDKTFSLK